MHLLICQKCSKVKPQQERISRIVQKSYMFANGFTANFLHVHSTCNACVPLCTCSMHVNGTFIACNNLCMYLRLLCLSCMLGKHANACLANRNLKVGGACIDSYLNREKSCFVFWLQALHVLWIKVTLTFQRPQSKAVAVQ